MSSFQLSIDSREDALEMIKKASIAGLISASLTALIVGVVVFTEINILGLDAWRLVDVVIIGGLTYSIYYHQSCTAAIILFGYHLINQAMFQLNHGVNAADLALALLFAFYYFQGIRGTIEYHKMKGEEEQADNSDEDSETVKKPNNMQDNHHYSRRAASASFMCLR